MKHILINLDLAVLAWSVLSVAKWDAQRMKLRDVAVKKDVCVYLCFIYISYTFVSSIVGISIDKTNTSSPVLNLQRN